MLIRHSIGSLHYAIIKVRISIKVRINIKVHISVKVRIRKPFPERRAIARAHLPRTLDR